MSNITLEKFKLMLTLQSEVNTISKPDWLVNPPNYSLASMAEAVEGLDHTPWKWWKGGEIHTDRLFMELVDITHFVLSSLLVAYNGSLDTTSQKYQFLDYFDSPSKVDVDQKLLEKKLSKLTFLSAYESHRFSEHGLVNLNCQFDILQNVFELTNLIGKSHQDLFISYIGKNVLNRFRQNNGYKQNTYIKMWGEGREDNDYLQDYLRINSFMAPEQLLDNSYKYMEEIYALIKGE
jgi:hypothetical protein